MSVLRDDAFSRRGRAQPQRRHAGALIFILMFISLALIVLSRLDHDIVKGLRALAAPILDPIIIAVGSKTEPVRRLGSRLDAALVSQAEVEALREEVQRLRGWEWRARELERELALLRAQVGFIEPPPIPFLTARVIADSAGPFARTVLLSAGRERGVQLGHPVINADGLIGRVVDVTEHAARVLLITDVNSQIPVVIGSANVRAIASGDNGNGLVLRHLPHDAEAPSGSFVATSGLDGIFPPSLRLGTLATRDGRTIVEPAAELTNIEFVSVMLYESPVQDLLLDTRGRRAP
ncbi:MAG: rod shape-determining protein MreC [Hyphomicrobiaceae bacterium]